MSNKNKKVVVNSMKWSMISEVLAKMILPVSNMLLARILMPEDFGALAILNMFLTGIDIFTDAGFGKYLIQKNFNGKEDRENAESVAFWTNFSISAVFAILIFIFSKNIASFFENMELELAFKIISITLFFTSFTSIQQNILKREFEFKKLFYIRIVLAFIPLVVTLPLAIITKSFWALIIGQLANSFVNMLLLSIFGKWKPKLFYSFKVLEQMLSFSIWSMFEAIGHWAIFWVDTFFASYFFSEYYLGLYKNTQNMTFAIFSIITTSVSSVLLPVLSRIKDEKEFEETYITIQRLVSYILFTMSMGLIFFSENVTSILLGEQWLEGTEIFMAGGFMMLFNTLFYSFPAEIYKSRGVPRELFFLQLEYLVFLIPIVFFASKTGFWTLIYARSLSIIILTVLSLIKLKRKMNMHPFKLLKNLFKPFVASTPLILMGIINKLFFARIDGILKNLSVVLIAGAIEIVFLLIFYRKDILNDVKKLN